MSEGQNLIDIQHANWTDFSHTSRWLADAFSRVSDRNRRQAWQELHRLSQDKSKYVRWSATYTIGIDFEDIPGPDKNQAWQDLHRLACDEDGFVRWSAAGALGDAFLFIPDLDRDQALQDLHGLTHDENQNARDSAADTLGRIFSYLPVPIKTQAWQDLYRLTRDEDHVVRWNAGTAMCRALTYLPDSDKTQIWQDLHKLTNDKDWYVRRAAARALGNAFSYASDKNQALQDLHELTQDKYRGVREEAAKALGNIFVDVSDPDRTQVWQDLHRLSQDNTCEVRCSATESLVKIFSQVPNKDQARKDLIRLTRDENRDVRLTVVSSLGNAFSQVPNKDQAWQDLIWQSLIRLIQDEDDTVQDGTIRFLVEAFSNVSNKYRAWKDLHNLVKARDGGTRMRTAEVLGNVFNYIPNKDQAWQDLIDLARDLEYPGVQSSAIDALGSAFSKALDKGTAWLDLRELAQDKDSYVRQKAVESIGVVFGQIADKNQAWQDLIRLTGDQDSDVRQGAAYVLGLAFGHLPEEHKDQAWQDFRELTRDKDSYVRQKAVESIGVVFGQIADKNQAWQDLHSLTSDKDISVRSSAAHALGSAFPSIPIENRNQAWQDLHSLTSDEDSSVRMNAYHSLGRVSVYKATMTSGDIAFQEVLETAIKFFESSSKEARYYDPAEFCLPFYRSFYAVTFQEDGSQDQVDRYLNTAKKAIGGSKSRELLLEAVKNLDQALKEVHGAGGRQEAQAVLEACRPYCERAAELLNETRDAAPGASLVVQRLVVRRGLPIFRKRIKEILGQIEDQAKRLCKTTKDTPFNQYGQSAHKTAQGLQDIESPVLVAMRLSEFVPLLKSICRILSEESLWVICRQLDGIGNIDPESKGEVVLSALSNINTKIAELTPEELEQFEVDGLPYTNELEIEIGNIFVSVYQKARDEGESEAGSKTLTYLKDALKCLSLSGRQLKWLDVGCGDGRCLDVLDEVPDRSKINYHGIDNSNKYLEDAEKRARSYGLKAELSKMDAAKMNFDSEFDLVSAVLILHEIDPLKLPCVLRNMIRALRKDGILIVSDFQGPYEQEMKVVSWSYEDLTLLVDKLGGSKIDGWVIPSSVYPSELGFYRCRIKEPSINEDRFKEFLQGYDKFLDKKKRDLKQKLEEQRAQIEAKVREILHRKDIDYKTLNKEDKARIKKIPIEYRIKAQKNKLLTNEIMFLDDKIYECKEKGFAALCP